MLYDVLVKILSVDQPSPEILLEADGDLCLDWYGKIDISIMSSGLVAWAVIDYGHGTDLDEFLAILKGYKF